MKVDHHSYRLNFCSCKKRAKKKLKACMGFESCVYNCDDNCDNLLPYILHPAVRIYDFNIFITSGYFFLNHFAPPSKGELMDRA